MSLVNDVFAVSQEVEDGRTPLTILGHATSELGELADEVLIAGGHSYKCAGDDGVVGEALDLMLCALDLIYVHTDGRITEEQLREIAARKLLKWKKNVDLMTAARLG